MHTDHSHMYDRFRRSPMGLDGDVGLMDRDERSIGDVVRDMTGHAQQLVRGELDLFKAEMAEKARTMALYIAMAAGAAVFGLIALAFVGVLIATALNTFMPAWAAWFVTTALYTGIAGGLGFVAIAGFRTTDLAPTDSVEQAKEDIQWVKAHS